MVKKSTLGAGSAIAIVAIIVTVTLFMIQSRPIVEYSIGYSQDVSPPLVLDYRTSSTSLTFKAINRGSTGAPIIVTIKADNAYIVDQSRMIYNQSFASFTTILPANAEDWSGWSYGINPIDEASNFTIKFSVEKNWKFNISGVINWCFGEYTPYFTSVTYDSKGTDVYRLRQ